MSLLLRPRVLPLVVRIVCVVEKQSMKLVWNPVMRQREAPVDGNVIDRGILATEGDKAVLGLFQAIYRSDGRKKDTSLVVLTYAFFVYSGLSTDLRLIENSHLKNDCSRLQSRQGPRGTRRFLRPHKSQVGTFLKATVNKSVTLVQ